MGFYLQQFSCLSFRFLVQVADSNLKKSFVVSVALGLSNLRSSPHFVDSILFYTGSGMGMVVFPTGCDAGCLFFLYIGNFSMVIHHCNIDYEFLVNIAKFVKAYKD
jgi:hypothetical protein